MKILVIGGGGREHALVWKLAQSPLVDGLWCLPGNPGIDQETLRNGRKVVCVPIDVADIQKQSAFARRSNCDLVVPGPEKTLVLGGANLLRQAGLMVCGPNIFGARFEGSKCFAQEFAERYKLPFAPGKCFSNPEEAKMFARVLRGKCAVKADGLFSGKGVIICNSVVEADEAIDSMLVHHKFGAAGERIVIQELLVGYELSLHILCDGKNWKVLPTAKDHKRLLNGDLGPQTGGMAAFSPHYSQVDVQKLAESIMVPFLAGCQAEGIAYVGVLYIGLMMTASGPKILEFNVRFGDPETQAFLPTIKTDFAQLLYATASGKLDEVELEIHSDRHAVCLVLAAPGYPENPVVGKMITGLDRLEGNPNIKVFHAGTQCDGPQNFNLLTAGGRILGVTAWETRQNWARNMAYEAAKSIEIEGGYQMRGDILF